MDIEPLPKKFYDRAVAAGVASIHLSFSGGSDEGFLDIELRRAEDARDAELGQLRTALETDLEEWAWEVYSYSGAGAGNDYGDDIVYDIKSKFAQHSDWCMQRQDGDTHEEPFSFADEDEYPTTPEIDPPVPMSKAALDKVATLRAEMAGPINPERVQKILDELTVLLEK